MGKSHQIAWGKQKMWEEPKNLVGGKKERGNGGKYGILVGRTNPGGHYV